MRSLRKQNNQVLLYLPGAWLFRSVSSVFVNFAIVHIQKVLRKGILYTCMPCFLEWALIVPPETTALRRQISKQQKKSRNT